MVKSIEQLLNGRYEYVVTPPHLSESAVRLQTPEGVDVKGTVTVSSADGQRLRGFGHVTNARVVLAHDRFTGTRIDITYGVDVHGLYAGDVVTGAIVLSLSTGEITIPVEVTIAPAVAAAKTVKVRSLNEFAAFAKQDYQEAFHMYCDGALSDVVAQEDAKTASLYRALTSGTVTYQHMEEFLVSTGRKEPLYYTLESEEEVFEHLTDSMQGSIKISKNTWGNVRLTVTSRGDFITLPQKNFLADDFVGNSLEIFYVISYDKLGDGTHKGTIEIDTDNGRMVYHVRVSKGGSAVGEERLDARRARAGAARDLLDYRLERIDGTAFMKRCVPKIAAIRRSEGESIALDLWEAYCYFLVGAGSAVSNLLKKWMGHDFGEEAAEDEALFLYLAQQTGLLSMDRRELADELAGLFAEDENSLIILTLLVRIDETLSGRPGRILSYMSRMYRNGNRSPFLYLEAALILRGHAHLMNSLTPFARNLCLFALRYGLADQDLCLRAALLSENEKQFSPAMYRILASSYRIYPMVDILSALCGLIIKGNPRNPAFHEWYALAVEEDIRLTRLYEYYMETLPEHYKKPLPVKVRRYFTMNNTLGAGRRAMLYANIILNKNFDRETYEEYEKAMSDFAKRMVPSGSMNEDFAVIYSEFVPTLPNKELAEAMARIMFRHAVRLDDPRIREVVVVHRALAQEEIYPVYHGTAYVDLYNDDAVLVFRDERGRRFLSGISYSVNRLMDYSAYVEPCRFQGVSEEGFVLYLCSRSDRVEDNEDCLQEYMIAASTPVFSDAYRRQVSGQLLSYFAAHPDSDSIDLYLTQTGMDMAAEANHTLLIEMMIRRGMMREAFQIATRYGYEDIEPNLLVKMVARMISLRDYAYDEELILAAFSAFDKDAANETTLRYLEEGFEGRVEDMIRVRQQCVEFRIPTMTLDEKILRYAMLCRVHAPEGARILRSYAEEGGSTKVQDAYMTFEALGSFYESKTLHSDVASALASSYDAGTLKNHTCALALLRYYTMTKDLTAEEEKRRNALLARAIREGHLFSFYQYLPSYLKQMYQLDDKLIIEYHGLPTDRVLISYRNSSEGEESFREDAMRRMVGGIFTKAFVMFGGQVLRYYTTTIRGDERIVSEETGAVMPVPEEKGRSRYQRIGAMMEEISRGDMEGFARSLRKYRLAEHTIETLFPLMGETAVIEEGDTTT